MSPRRRRLAGGSAGALVVVALSAAAVHLAGPTPVPRVQLALRSAYTVSGSTAPLPWPATGQAALYLSGYGWLGGSGGQASASIASVTKVMTALVILRAHPLALGLPGPMVTVSASDASLYQQERAAGDSVVPVVAGENLTELQLLEGLLLPSGDNIAVLLAEWDAGSEPAFVLQMNRLATSLHLAHTHFADSSGLDPSSVSCARDLVTLAEVAMREKAFASIVGMATARLPVVGTVRNYNPVLGEEGITGIKTGWTASALGCLLFAAVARVGERQVKLVGAVIGQPGGPTSGLVAAGRAAVGLLAAALPQLRWVRLPASGAVVGEVLSPWGRPDPIQLTRPIQLVAVSGSALSVRPRLRRIRTPIRRGVSLGTVTLTHVGGFRLQEAVLVRRTLVGPNWWWRLTHDW